MHHLTFVAMSRTDGSDGSFVGLIPFFVIVGVVYFLFIKPRLKPKTIDQVVPLDKKKTSKSTIIVSIVLAMVTLLVFSIFATIGYRNINAAADKVNESTANYLEAIYDKDTNVIPAEKHINIYFNDFKNKTLGKTTDEIKQMYGAPDEAQEMSGMKVWYFMSDSNNLRKIRIYNEDTEKEIRQVQVVFTSGYVSRVNAY